MARPQQRWFLSIFMGLRVAIIGHYLELQHGKLIIPLAMRLFWLIILGLPCLCLAQVPEGNLIPNWSFEILRPDLSGDTLCPMGTPSIYRTTNWGMARGSVDYFHACCNAENPNYGVPYNRFGNQDPFDGVAYVHFASYLYEFDDAREFVWLPLPDSLKSGQGYTFRMRVSRADSADFGVDKIGALFSKEDTRTFVVNQFENEFLTVQPQIESPGGTDQIIADEMGWSTIEGQFVASGGEKFLTIGSFHSDGNLFVQQVGPVDENGQLGTLDYHEAYGYVGFASYYLDAVELYENNSIGIKEPEFTFSIYPNPATTNLTIESRTPLAQVWVRDVAGRAIMNGTLRSAQSDNKTLDVSSLPSGIYLVEVLTQNGQHSVQKVVVE
jgi:hypothetical protein